MYYYYVYKITNNVNKMIYVGIHRTDDLNDGYMGSGVLLKRAWKKYGRENFTKEILKECETIEEMFEMETQIVTKDFVRRKDNYNTMVGGPGGPKEARTTEYFKSGEHTTNILAAREIALVACKKKKDDRVRQYDTNPSLCKYCDGALPYKKRHNKFCNNSCAASSSNTGRVVTESHKQKLRATIAQNKSTK